MKVNGKFEGASLKTVFLETFRFSIPLSIPSSAGAAALKE